MLVIALDFISYWILLLDLFQCEGTNNSSQPRCFSLENRDIEKYFDRSSSESLGTSIENLDYRQWSRKTATIQALICVQAL